MRRRRFDELKTNKIDTVNRQREEINIFIHNFHLAATGNNIYR
jgi:hypothetical protein